MKNIIDVRAGDQARPGQGGYAMDVLIALDQGTTSSRCLGFDAGGNVVALAQREFAQHFPRDGWVEHEPEDIWRSTLESFDAVVRELLAAGHAIVGIGISNQRETTLLWDRRTGEAVHRAIVWQDRRTADACARLQQEGLGECVATRTGLLLDPYFSATKLAWILDNVAGARARAEAGELAFGTVDTFLLWRLTGGRRHCTDATNASRTMLFDIHAQRWDEELLARFARAARGAARGAGLGRGFRDRAGGTARGGRTDRRHRG